MLQPEDLAKTKKVFQHKNWHPALVSNDSKDETPRSLNKTVKDEENYSQQQRGRKGLVIHYIRKSKGKPKEKTIHKTAAGRN